MKPQESFENAVMEYSDKILALTYAGITGQLEEAVKLFEDMNQDMEKDASMAEAFLLAEKVLVEENFFFYRGSEMIPLLKVVDFLERRYDGGQLYGIEIQKELSDAWRNKP